MPTWLILSVIGHLSLTKYILSNLVRSWIGVSDWPAKKNWKVEWLEGMAKHVFKNDIYAYFKSNFLMKRSMLQQLMPGCQNDKKASTVWMLT